MYFCLKIAAIKALPSPFGGYHQTSAFRAASDILRVRLPTKSWRAHKPRCFPDQEGDIEIASSLEIRNFSFAGCQALPTDNLFLFEDLGCNTQMIGGRVILAQLSLNGRICGIY